MRNSRHCADRVLDGTPLGRGEPGAEVMKEGGLTRSSVRDSCEEGQGLMSSHSMCFTGAGGKESVAVVQEQPGNE